MRESWLTARLTANVTRPPIAVTVPARIKVLPRENSLIGMPNPIRIAPSARARMPITINTKDITQPPQPTVTNLHEL